jgi:hypothetical protein
MCQRTAGAPVLAFASVPKDALQWIKGYPKKRRSSDIGERWHCQDCGTPLVMHVSYQPDCIDFAVVTLDDPSKVVPEFHIWRESAVAWFDTADALPRHPRSRPHIERNGSS